MTPQNILKLTDLQLLVNVQIRLLKESLVVPFSNVAMTYFLYKVKKDLRREPRFNPITYTISKEFNWNYWQENVLAVIWQNIAGRFQQTFCFQMFVDNVQ